MYPTPHLAHRLPVRALRPATTSYDVDGVSTSPCPDRGWTV